MSRQTLGFAGKATPPGRPRNADSSTLGMSMSMRCRTTYALLLGGVQSCGINELKQPSHCGIRCLFVPGQFQVDPVELLDPVAAAYLVKLQIRGDDAIAEAGTRDGPDSD